MGPYPQPVLAHAASIFGAVEVLSLHSSTNVGDEFLGILSTSSTAATLRVFRQERGFISDESASYWLRFPLLRELTLENTSFISMATVQELSKHTTLERLHLSSSRILSSEAIAAVLAPEALPKLTHLVLSTTQRDTRATLRALKQCLGARPNVGAIENIDLGIEKNQISFGQAISLHRSLPNTRRLIIEPRPYAAEKVLTHRLKMANFRELELVFSSDPGIIGKIADVVPLLEKIKFCWADDKSVPLDFSVLPFLTALGLQYTRCSAGPLHLPTSFLTELTLALPGTAVESYDALCDAVCRATKLASLEIDTEELRMQRKHLDKFLTALPLLRNISIRSNSAPSPAPPQHFVLSHPNLLEWTFQLEENLTVQRGWLPELRIMDDQITNAGSLYPMVSLFMERDSTEPFDLPGVGSLSGVRLPGLREVSLQKPRSFSSFWDFAGAHKNLGFIQLGNVELSRVEMNLVVASFPRLHTLSVTIAWNHSGEIVALKHPLLSALWLSFAASKPTTKEESRPLDTFRFKGANLPCLERLKLDSLKGKMPRIQILNSVTVERVLIDKPTPGGELVASLRLKGCPVVRDICFSRCHTVASCHLIGAKRLEILRFLECQNIEPEAFRALEAPSLREVQIFPDEFADVLVPILNSLPQCSKNFSVTSLF